MGVSAGSVLTRPVPRLPICAQTALGLSEAWGRQWWLGLSLSTPLPFSVTAGQRGES